MQFEGRVALVTGAARNIGRATALGFAREGANIVITALTHGAEAEAVAQEARDMGRRALVCTLDTTDAAAVAVMAREVQAQLGGVDILVLNAAIRPEASILEMSYEDWRRVIDVNLDSAFLFSKHAIPAMEGGGSIILIASQLGRVARPGRPWYCAAKGALIQLAKAMALDHAGQHIRVNSLSPGPVETARYLRNFDTLDAARASHHTLVGRLGSPEEIAAGAVYLAGDESTFVTGADLLIDGGYTAV